MKRSLIYIFTFLFFCFLFSFCVKRVFVHIRIKGTLIDFFTGQPVPSHLTLTWIEIERQNSGGISSGETNANGEFDIKGNATWKKNYLLSFGSNDKTIGGNAFFGTLENNSTLDIGNVNVDHIFSCKVTLNSIHNNTLTIEGNSSIQPETNFLPGTNSIFTHTTTYSKSFFERRNGNYLVSYRIDSTNNLSYVRALDIPITNSNLTATINF